MVFYTSDLFFDDIDVATKRHLSVSDMNSIIVSNWNKIICSDDTIYILGGIGNFEYLNSLKGKKILVMSENEKGHFIEYVEGITSNRDDDCDYEMYESHIKKHYNVDKLCKSGSVIKKIYSGRLIRVATNISTVDGIDISIVGSVNELQRVSDKFVNCNIMLNGYFPISEVEVEDLIHRRSDLV